MISELKHSVRVLRNKKLRVQLRKNDEKHKEAVNILVTY